MEEAENEEVENKNWREKIQRKYGWKGEKRAVKDTQYCYRVLLLLLSSSSSSSLLR
jgi:hypothetical protein